jgi:hypothetical protein
MHEIAYIWDDLSGFAPLDNQQASGLMARRRA